MADINFNLLDPNNEILKGTPWYDANSTSPLLANPSKTNGIPRFEDIRSFVEFSMIPKNPNYIEINNQRITSNAAISDDNNIILGGYYKRKDSKGVVTQSYYSTNYTDELMGSSVEPKEYEGFGIKSIDITFDANKIPQVGVVFYDLRGNVLNDFNSRFAKMFQLPYPIFQLRIKGGFGPLIKFRLQKIKDDISVDESGNFIINSKFIGDKFAPLSDVPLQYLNTVSYFNDNTIDLLDNKIVSFQDLIVSSRRLYEKANQEVESDQENKNKEDLRAISEKRSTIFGIFSNISDIRKFKELFTKETIKEATPTITDAEITSIINYIGTTTIPTDTNKILFVNQTNILLSASVKISENSYGTIYNIVSKHINTINSNLKTGGFNVSIAVNPLSTVNSTIPTFQTISIIKDIDFSKIADELKKLDNQIEDSAIKNNTELNKKMRSLSNQVLGSTRLTIGTVFKFMIDDYNSLMKLIKKAGDDGGANNLRFGVDTYDKIGFPKVIDVIDGVSTLIYPGSKPEFQDWPEVKFIEDFIKAYSKSLINNELASLLNSKNEDGSSRYIPINPREVYQLTRDNPPSFDTRNEPRNIYFGKTLEQICKLIYERFLIITNINAVIDTTSFSDWDNGSADSQTWGTFFKDVFGTLKLNNVDVQKQLFLATIQIEARNIAYAVAALDQKVKDYFKNLNTNFNDTFLSTNTSDPMRLGIVNPTNNNLELMGNSYPDNIKTFGSLDYSYITVANAMPQLIDAGSQQTDIISEYMKSVTAELNENVKITKDNIFYYPDSKLSEKSNESDYDPIETIGSIFRLSYQKNNNKKIDVIYKTLSGDKVYGCFSIWKFIQNINTTGVYQVPRGILVIFGMILKDYYSQSSGQQMYSLNFGNMNTINDIDTIKIIRNSSFFNYLYDEAEDFEREFPLYVSSHYLDSNGVFDSNLGFDLVLPQGTTVTTEETDRLIAYMYEKRYVSVNDIQATTIYNKNYNPSLSNSKYPDSNLYSQYLKNLLPKLSQLIVDDEKKINDKVDKYKSMIYDNDVKLAAYKSFQLIYENYLHGVSENEFTLKVNNQEDSSFIFVDRAYNDISDLCILDIKTLLDETEDSNANLLTAISRVLTDNNFWFYPFQGFLTTTKNYNDLFKINYDKETPVKPVFVAMFVGGLSSNPNTNINSTLENDGIMKGNIPPDFKKKTGSMNAFLVKYTGTQNQMVFSNFEHSTESLKNTDEGLRIQSDIIRNASNSFSIPKGQSLLTVYQKQSYSSTIKIPFGNMGIQPTQYYYEEFIPIFEGLYIIYNVTHSIDAENQRLETTFKGYRLKKDVNPIVVQELVDFGKNNAYLDALGQIGSNRNAAIGSGIMCGKASSVDVNTVYPRSVKWQNGSQPIVCPITNPPTITVDLDTQKQVIKKSTRYTEKQVIDAADTLVDKISPGASKENKKRVVTSALAIAIQEQGLKGFNNNLTGVESSGFKVFATTDVNGKVQASEGGTGLIKTYYSFTSLSSGLIPLVSKIIERNMFAQKDDPNEFAWRYFRDWNGYGGRTTVEYQSGKIDDCTYITNLQNIYKRALRNVDQYSKFA
jgi:hypothetical protein